MKCPDHRFDQVRIMLVGLASVCPTQYK